MAFSSPRRLVVASICPTTRSSAYLGRPPAQDQLKALGPLSWDGTAHPLLRSSPFPIDLHPRRWQRIMIHIIGKGGGSLLGLS